ncbi:MAG TPA: hypothetical protein DCF78_07885, partial [Dehalococcoidia bacterium]|nr:hypothetical protein [Dehalococcoidia bacterium]
MLHSVQNDKWQAQRSDARGDMTMEKSEYLQPVIQAIDANREELVGISLDIHSHPELNFQEHHAAKLLADTLEQHGFQVERGVGGVETAFRGTLEGGG